MRSTCLRCGQQSEYFAPQDWEKQQCACEQGDKVSLQLRACGVRPSEQAANAARQQAFWAAGITRNLGGFALAVSALSIVCFPIGIVGVGISMYCLTMVKGPAARYSGRTSAWIALLLAIGIMLGEGSMAWSWWQHARMQQMYATQQGIQEELRQLRRAQRLYRARHDRYGSFQELAYQPTLSSPYTLYLGPKDICPSQRQGKEHIDPLPQGLMPEVTANTFTVVAVANLDGDGDPDVWIMYDNGTLTHASDDGVLP